MGSSAFVVTGIGIRLPLNFKFTINKMPSCNSRLVVDLFYGFIFKQLMKQRNTYEPIMRKTVFWTRKDWRELSQSDVLLQEKIGEGAFGQVFKGLVQIDGQSKYCAVKMLKGKKLEFRVNLIFSNNRM